MSTNRTFSTDRYPDAAAKSIHDHWVLFVMEGAILIVLGVLAVAIPSMADLPVILFLGWLFLLSGVVGLVATYWARRAPGYLWSLVSALLAIIVGAALIAQRVQDVYGGPIGWPFEKIGSLWLVLAFFFLIEGLASLMFAIEHRRQVSGRWGWMLTSGIIDLILASIIIFGLRGAAAWTMGLLVGINMVFGGASLLAMGLHERTEIAART
jgi:uncharacterized membrane protein HdeD (DUF308 family)